MKNLFCLRRSGQACRTRALIGLIVVLSQALPLSAQTEDELFGSAESIVTESAGAQAETEKGLLETDAIKIGGEFSLDFGGSGNPVHWAKPSGADDPLTPFAAMSVNLFADARPTGDFRFFIKGKLDRTDGNAIAYGLKEAFADIQPLDGLFVRAGKQTANWGVGYFFSPGNLLDLSEIDPENPLAERTGPFAIKMQAPFGANTLYTYLLLDDTANGGSTGIAPKAEWLAGSAEFAVGGLWKQDDPWALTASATFPIRSLDVFAEAVLRGNDDRRYLTGEETVPGGVAVETRGDAIVPLATAGFRWSKTDDEDRFDATLVSQYFYNGAGYADTAIISDNPAAVGMLLMEKKISANDLRERGRHYGAAVLTIGDILDSDAGVSLFWLGNLTDLSGKTSVTGTWDGLEHVRLSLACDYSYGETGSEYAKEGPAPSVTLKVSLTRGTF